MNSQRLQVCKYLEIRPSPDRSPPGPSVEKHSGQWTFSEQPDTVPTTEDAKCERGEGGVILVELPPLDSGFIHLYINLISSQTQTCCKR
jgi:hypothetical protein